MPPAATLSAARPRPTFFDAIENRPSRPQVLMRPFRPLPLAFALALLAPFLSTISACSEGVTAVCSGDAAAGCGPGADAGASKAGP